MFLSHILPGGCKILLMDMFNEPVVFVDIETNGGAVGRGSVIEIAAIRVEQGEIVNTFTTLVNPGNPVPHWITNLTGITNSDLVQAPYFEDIAEQLKQILEGAIFAAHNVRFDYSFIKNHFKQLDYDYKPKLFCTVRMSRALYPEHKGHSLEKIISRHGIAVADRHRAYADAQAILDFTKLVFTEKGSEAFELAKIKQFKTKSLPPNLDAKYLEGVEDKPGVYIFETESGSTLYIGKSVSLKSRIKSHFTQDTAINKEMRLSMQSHKLSVIETSNELEALLLESSLIKEKNPILNRQLRRVKSHFVFMADTNEQGYRTIAIADKDLAKVADLSAIYGMFTNRAKAKTSLETHLKTFSLCPKLLGLEKTKGACFQYQLGRCRGACIGKETPQSYNLRIELALERTKIDHWPFKSSVAISDGKGDMIVVNNWIIEGYLTPVEDSEPDFRPIERSFELDTYRILRSYLLKNKGKLSIKPIDLSLFRTQDFESGVA